MAIRFGEYDPTEVYLNINGFRVTGVYDGTFIDIKRNAKRYGHKVGGDGSFFLSKSPDKSGTITFTLGVSSDSNSVISDMILDQDRNNTLSTVDCHLLSADGEIFELNEGLICVFDMDLNRGYDMADGGPSRQYSLLIGRLDQR